MKAFQCRKCGDCCYGEGGISVEDEQVERIARFLWTTPESFVSRFCEQRHGRLYVRTGPGKFCIFYDMEDGCLIHPVKPRQCSLWPFYRAIVNDRENWEMAKDACPGINADCSFEEFVRQSTK